MNGFTKVGFLKKTPWAGSNGIADLKMEEEFQKLMKFKLKDGKHLGIDMVLL